MKGRFSIKDCYADDCRIFFSYLRTNCMPGKIDSPGVDITNCQNDNCENPQRGRLRINK